jgi:thioredoxin
LDGGEGNKHPVITPQMPTGRLIRQPVLHDQTHGQGDHAVGVAGFGQTIFRGVGVKELVALGAAVLRIAQFNITGLARNQVAHVVEHASTGPIAKARLAALRTRQMFEVTAATHELRLREIFGIGDPRSGVGYILSRPSHGNALLGLTSLARTLPHLRSPIIPDLHAMMLKTHYVSLFPYYVVVGLFAIQEILPLERRTTMAENIAQVSDATFDSEVLKSTVPVLIDFWAPWCGPCRAIAPIVDELAGEYAGKLKVVKMNVDDNPRTPAQYGVRGIPNLILFKDGQVAQQIVGAVPKAQLVKAITTVVV